jgi:hypothetical protein
MRVENKRTYRGPGLYIGRPSKYGNPYKISDYGDERNRFEVIKAYELHARDMLAIDPTWLDDLRGYDVLICWCAPLACHGDVLVRMLSEVDNDSQAD